MKDAEKTVEMATRICEAIVYDPELSKYAPDALVRVLVYLVKGNGWSLDKIEREALIGIRHYYEND